MKKFLLKLSAIYRVIKVKIAHRYRLLNAISKRIKRDTVILIINNHISGKNKEGHSVNDFEWLISRLDKEYLDAVEKIKINKSGCNI